ncbi:hypothetical protein [Rathayibacter agropyri]|uniref:hypothetical protein n=1 Tax=Rathayibacter agropyri TaxID=1634927 RepID=UPI00156690C0|nr:hypothetical protein [Rathayibacter agropyri]NRD10094.1 hypothetical protein [Rathayibacter agropyri]
MTVTREKPFWVAEVEGLPGGATETRALADIDGEVRDLISGLADVDEEEISLTWDYSHAFPESVATALTEMLQAREALVQTRSAYERLQHDAVVGIREQGISVRDAAVLVQLSHQRVAQIAS